MMSGELFQIYEDDLVELERTLPNIVQHLASHFTARQRTQLRRIKDILSNVRWGYGPPTDVTEIKDAE